MENKISELIFSFMKTASINCVEIEKGVWKANIPEKERPFFNGAETIPFTFNREIAEKHRDIELVSEGSFLLRKIVERVAKVPKVSRVFSTKAPEMPPKTIGIVNGKAHYRAKVAFNFKITYDCEHREEKLYSVVADTASDEVYIGDKLFEPDMNEFSTKPEPDIKIEDSGHDILRLYMESCKRLEEHIVPELEKLREVGGERYNEEIRVFDAYLDEQKNELIKKKENVSFHLYFFQKEEEIDKLISNLEEERKRKVEELREKYRVKVDIDLIDAIVLEIPTIGEASSKTRKTVK